MNPIYRRCKENPNYSTASLLSPLKKFKVTKTVQSNCLNQFPIFNSKFAPLQKCIYLMLKNNQFLRGDITQRSKVTYCKGICWPQKAFDDLLISPELTVTSRGEQWKKHSVGGSKNHFLRPRICACQDGFSTWSIC